MSIIIIGSVGVILINSISNKDKGLTINGILMLEKFKKDKIGVYIDGEVNNPGYIQIPNGSTLEYAINEANGITKKADIQNIDVKRELKNQEKIIIPAVKEDEGSISDDYKININTASVEELTGLEGIGKKTAEKIIEYRKINEFDSIDELIEVKGIGEGKFEKIKEEICV